VLASIRRSTGVDIPTILQRSIDQSNSRDGAAYADPRGTTT
jgi:hypothetical protein